MYGRSQFFWMIQAVLSQRASVHDSILDRHYFVRVRVACQGVSFRVVTATDSFEEHSQLTKARMLTVVCGSF